MNNQPTTVPITEAQMEELRRFVAERMAKPIAVADLAELVHMSESCFFKLFKESTGHTPHQFIVSERVAYAAEMIRESNHLTLAQVAERSGFADQAHLTRAFREATGQTPAQFCRHQDSP